MFSSPFSLNKLWHFGTVFKIRSETCRTKAQFCQNLYMIKKESLPDRPKFCGSASAVRHLFWRLLISRQACFVNQVLNMWSLEGHKNNNFFEVLNKKNSTVHQLCQCYLGIPGWEHILMELFCLNSPWYSMPNVNIGSSEGLLLDQHRPIS